jgi:integral membrane protein
VSSPLTRYRIMAYIVGTMLIVLVFVAIPLQYGFSKPTLAQIVSPIHGILYMIYLVTVWDLARRGGFTRRQLAAMVGAGFIPTLAFIVERRITRDAARAEVGGGASTATDDVASGGVPAS